MSVSGLLTWLALPDGKEWRSCRSSRTRPVSNCLNSTTHGASGRVVIGSFDGLKSPVRAASDTLYADIRLEPGASVRIPADAEERAIYTLDGTVSISGDRFPDNRLLVFKPGDEIVISSENGAHFMLFGGASLGSESATSGGISSSSKERIEQAQGRVEDRPLRHRSRRRQGIHSAAGGLKSDARH